MNSFFTCLKQEENEFALRKREIGLFCIFACKNACRTTVRANRMYALSLIVIETEREREKKGERARKAEREKERTFHIHIKKREFDRPIGKFLSLRSMTTNLFIRRGQIK